MADEAGQGRRPEERCPGHLRVGPGLGPSLRLLRHPAWRVLLRQLPGSWKEMGAIRFGDMAREKRGKSFRLRREIGEDVFSSSYFLPPPNHPFFVRLMGRWKKVLWEEKRGKSPLVSSPIAAWWSRKTWAVAAKMKRRKEKSWAESSPYFGG